MSQSDFATLVVQDDLAEKSPETESCNAEVLDFSKCQERVDLQHAKSEVLATCFSDAMYDFVAACEASCMSSAYSYEYGMDTNVVSVSQDIFEPSRRMTDFGPPKLFYRTFWRSASRRILALSSEQTKQDGS